MPWRSLSKDSFAPSHCCVLPQNLCGQTQSAHEVLDAAVFPAGISSCCWGVGGVVGGSSASAGSLVTQVLFCPCDCFQDGYSAGQPSPPFPTMAQWEALEGTGKEFTELKMENKSPGRLCPGSISASHILHSARPGGALSLPPIWVFLCSI